MDATVKLLREQGRRRPIAAINADRGACGRLALVTGPAGSELRLASPDPRHDAPVAVLYDAQLVMLHHHTMMFCGVERGPGGAEHEQEWSVRIALATGQGQLFAAEAAPWPIGD